MPARRGLMPTALLAVLLACPFAGARADDAPFEVHYSAQGRVGVAYAANGLLSCDGGEANCRGVRGGVVQLQNTQLDMTFIDVDPPALGDLDADGRDDTRNSSAAVLDLPEGARVEFARVYVAGIWRVDNANTCGDPREVPPGDRSTIRFAAPGAGYTTVQGELIGDDGQALGAGYAAAFDVTPYIDGSGAYWVADAALIQGRCAAGGWSLVVAYRTDDGPPRSVVLTAGYVTVADVDLQIAVDGLLTPPSDAPSVTIAVGAVEGDRGLDGDGGSLDATALSDPLNPADDLFNSTISRDGGNVDTRTPAHLNNIAYDFDVLDATGALAPDSRSAQLRFTAGRDFVKAFFVGLSAELAVPRLTIAKTARVLQGEPDRPVEPGDRIEYTLDVQAAADNNDAAVDAVLEDALPVEVEYLAETVEVRGAGVFEAPVAGEVEYDAEAHQLTVRPPAELEPGATFAVRFTVEVLPSARRAIANSATVTWSGATAGPALLLDARSDSDPEQAGDQPTIVDVAALPDMGRGPDMALDAGALDAGALDGAVDAMVDAGPRPDVVPADAGVVDSTPDGRLAMDDAGLDGGAREESLLAEGEDVAGGLLFGCDAADGPASAAWALLLLLWTRRRRWAPVLALGLLALPRPAAAVERFDVQRFAPATDPRHHGLRIMSARLQPGPRWSAGLLLDHADDPLTVEVDGERTRSLVARQTRAHLIAHGVFTRWLEVGVAVPVMLDAAGDGAVGGPGMGDIRVQGRVVLWSPDADPQTALALVVDGYLGTGDVDAFHGDVGRRVETRVAASHRLGGVDLRANLGWMSRGAARLGNLEVGDALTLGLGAEVPLADGWTLLPELDGAVAFASDLDIAEIPFEALIGARWLADDAWSAVGALGAGLIPGVGVPDLRFILGFSYTRTLPETLTETLPSPAP